MLTLIFTVVVAAFLFYYFIVKPYDYWKERGIKQGNHVWIFGDNWKMLFRKESFAEWMENAYKQYPGLRYYGVYQFFTPTLIIKDKDLINRIAIKDFEHFSDHRPFVPVESDPVWARNLAALNGKSWHNMRSVLSPSFTSSKMRTMFVLISECAENFVQHFQKKNEDILSLEFKDIFTRFTNDVIATTAFGIQVDSLSQPDNTFYMTGQKITDFSNFWRNLKFFGYILMPKIYKIFKLSFFEKSETKFFVDVVSETVKVREEKGILRPDMINLLMEARKGIQRREENTVIDTGFATAQESDLVKPTKQLKEMTDMDMAAQAMVFFFAGFDTVSSLLGFLTYELTVNPDVQDKLREEILRTFEKCGGKLTYEDLLKMKYMDMVISEALRKWPIAAALDRLCTKPYTIQPAAPHEKPLLVEKGTLLFLPILGIHRDPEYYPDPDRFDPERFSDENKDKIKPYTYFPFGLGPRNCIGSRFALLETKVILFHMLQHFEYVPTEKSTIPLKLNKKHFSLSGESFWFGLKRITVQT